MPNLIYCSRIRNQQLTFRKIEASKSIWKHINPNYETLGSKTWKDWQIKTWSTIGSAACYPRIAFQTKRLCLFCFKHMMEICKSSPFCLSTPITKPPKKRLHRGKWSPWTNTFAELNALSSCTESKFRVSETVSAPYLYIAIVSTYIVFNKIIQHTYMYTVYHCLEQSNHRRSQGVQNDSSLWEEPRSCSSSC